MRKCFILFTVLYFIGFRSINVEAFDPKTFMKISSENTVTSFTFEEVKVTVLGRGYWITDPVGPFVILDLGIFIDEEIYRLYLAGDIKARFVLTHELCHIIFRHNIPMEAAIHGTPDQATKYMEKEIDADVWASKHLGISFNQYEAIRKWIDQVYFREFLTRYRNYSIDWTIEQIIVKEKEQIAGVAKLLPPSQAPLPPIPQNVRVENIGDNTVNLFWDSLGTGVSYKGYVAMANDPQQAYEFYQTMDTGLSANNLNAGTTYYFWVTSLKGGLESGKSAMVTVQTTTVQPQPQSSYGYSFEDFLDDWLPYIISFILAFVLYKVLKDKKRVPLKGIMKNLESRKKMNK